MNQNLPAQCATTLLVDGKPAIIRRGESGYYPQPDGFDVDLFNAENNVTDAQRQAMVVGSMFGWDCPGANPAIYEK